jgi:hypothetical protein
MCKIKVQVADTEHGDPEDRFVELPAQWAICGTCRGNGKHSLRFGAITGSEWDEWSHDEQDNYMSGLYDQACDDCEGTGKVMVVDRDACQRSPKLREALKTYDNDRAIDDEIDAMHAAEIAYGC